MATSTPGRRIATVLAIAAGALVVGWLFATPRDGAAASDAAPTNTATPTVSGSPRQGSTLTASTGTWTNSPTSYTYQWSRCDTNGDACSDISGADSQTYTLQGDDVGKTLRVTVTAKNADGSGTATSAPTAVVANAQAPENTSPPTISGSAQLGSTLTATQGGWNNASSYAYQWSRCDQNGGSCASIGGATGATYKVGQIDQGNTLRVTVTATNSAGSTSSTSVPTAVVPTPAPPVVTGCPGGSGTMQVSSVSLPARLQIDQPSLSPTVVTRSTQTIVAQFRVTACGGRPVQGALVYATGVPYNQFSIAPEGATDADGTVRLTMHQLSGFPAARRQELLVMFVRARKPNDPLTGGISTRLLVSFPVSLRG